MPTTSTTKSTPSSHGAPTRLNEGIVPKEVRAHEHARQRTKERREYSLAKERKEKAAAVRVLSLKGGCHNAHGAKLVRKLSMESWDGEQPQETVRAVQNGVPGTLAHTLGPEHASEHDVISPRDGTSTTSAFTALTLGDLISKPRRPKAKHLDFEVISPIRAVIALDDAETDEQWEYITRASVNDGSAWMGKSYAQVVASAM